MEIGIDSFASVQIDGQGNPIDPGKSMEQLLEKITFADRVGLDVFGVGEHYRREFLDSAPTVIMAAAAARTQQIRLVNAVAVLSAADPVRLFQSYATLDLISGGRAEMVAGRGSFIESFPLFGLRLQDYDDIFSEKLKLLLLIRDKETVSWSGRFRPPLDKQDIYPRPLQNPFPLWLGVGGTPASFVRAGTLGLSLMVAIIGGHAHRFLPLLELYRKSWRQAGHAEEKLRVGIHFPGYVAETDDEAIEAFYPGYLKTFGKIGQERGWSPVSRRDYEDLVSPAGAFIVGSPETVAKKILRHSQSLGGIDRVTFQMDIGHLSHEQYLSSVRLIGEEVKPMVNGK